MNLTRTRFSRLLRISAFAALAVIVIGYALFRSLPYIYGPTITILQPVNGSSISTTTVTLIGKADRINSLMLNGRPVTIDEQGNFKEIIIVFPGTNIITLEGSDQFKRTEKTELQIFGSY